MDLDINFSDEGWEVRVEKEDVVAKGNVTLHKVVGAVTMIGCW